MCANAKLSRCNTALFTVVGVTETRGLLQLGENQRSKLVTEAPTRWRAVCGTPSRLPACRLLPEDCSSLSRTPPGLSTLLLILPAGRCSPT